MPVSGYIHCDEWVTEVTFTNRQKYTPSKQKLALVGYFKFKHRSGTCPELGKLPDAVLTKQFSSLLLQKVYGSIGDNSRQRN